MMQNISIRKGTYDDLPAVYTLVQELAIYEKEPEAVVASLSEYQRDFREGIFETLVAEENGEVVGMMLYYTAYSTWKGKMIYLDDFVIQEQYRRKGIGQLLYNKLLEVGKAKGVRLLKWQVLDWNEPAIQFYQKNHAEIEKGWYNVKLFLS